MQSLPRKVGRAGRSAARASAVVSTLGKLLAQAAVVAQRDAEAIADPYAWPPRAPLSRDEQREVDRLRALSNRLSYDAACVGQTDQSYAAIFDFADEPKEDT